MGDFEGAEPICRALCWIGAAYHSTDPAHQLEVAKAIHDQWVEHGDEYFKPDQALIDFIAKSLGKDPGKLRKAP